MFRILPKAELCALDCTSWDAATCDGWSWASWASWASWNSLFSECKGCARDPCTNVLMAYWHIFTCKTWSLLDSLEATRISLSGGSLYTNWRPHK
jgi:hypothetical protein